MELQQLVDKLKSEGLSPEEQQSLFMGLGKDLQALKEQDPQKYLETVNILTSMVKELTAILKK